MRVAIDARYIREKPSGIGTYVRAIVDRVPAAAPSDTFLFWAHPLAPRPLSAAPNTAQVTVVPGPNSPLTIWFPARSAPFDQVDVFHSPHNLMPRGLRCATVVTVMDVMAIDRPGLHLQGIERLVKSTYYPQAVWRALRQATQLIVPTRAVADRIAALAPDAAPRVSVVTLAADECFRPAVDPGQARSRAAGLLGTDAPYVIVIGANAPSKGHDLAVAAFAAGAPPPWRLVLLQRQGRRDVLRRLARQWHVEDRIIWRPAVEREEVVTLLQAAAALIQPSIYEGFGLPIVEAMACGCPVIASDIPTFVEITGGAAVLVAPGDASRLAAAMQQLVASPELRRSLGERSLERAQAFSWDRCARETLDVYRRAAS